MKILLINPPFFNTITSALPEVIDEERGANPPLGLLYVAGYLKKYTNHEIIILDCQLNNLTYNQIEEKIKELMPDVVGITTMTFTLIDVIKLAKITKKINTEIKVILGGPHVNIYPEETIKIPEIDFLVLGEGEAPAKDLLENIYDQEKLKNVRGIVFKNNGQIINTGSKELIKDLDSLPFPARELTEYKKYTSILSHANIVTTMFTSRGCPYHCAFCDRPHLGKLFRARSAKSVIDEMQECQKMGINEILIYDDTFTVNRQRVVDICNEIIKRHLKISWDVRARVNTVDYELLKLMKKAGCTRIHYGVEAGTEKILTVLRKEITLEMAEKAFKMTKKAGIETLGYFMIGSPTETEEDIKQTIKFAKKLNPDYVHITILMPFPATDIYRQALEKKVIPKDVWLEFAKNPTKDFKPPFWEENFNSDQLNEFIRKAYREFYFRPSYILKRLLSLRSFKEFQTKTRAGVKLLLLSFKKKN